MQDTLFFSGTILACVALAQVPEVSTFKELSATVMLGVLFWYTLTRINTGLTTLSETIHELTSTIQNHFQTEDHEKEK